MICAKLKPAVSGLEKEFPGRVKAKNEDASTPENRKTVEELGFNNHGLVVRGEKGKVLFKQPDHTVKIEDVRKALQDILK